VNKKDTLMYSQITKVNMTSNLESLLPHLNRDQNNVLFVPSSNSTFITNLFNYLVNVLNKKEFKNTQITLIGLEEWLKYENIDLEYFQRLNVYIPVTQHINYEDSLTNNFTNSYVEKNNTFPSKISFLGYDIATYFAGNLKAYGSVYLNSETHSEVENYSIKQSFFKTGIESGYENTNSYMLHFDNYILKKVD